MNKLNIFKLRSILPLLLLLTYNLAAQAVSEILYSSGTTINVGSGADVCATNVIINGTWMGTGTICGGALPVSISLFTFTVKERNVQLNWITEWEMNNSGFDVERAQVNETGTGSWIKLGFVQGKGTVNEPNIYSYNDTRLNAGKYRYRLKQVDHNGHYEYFQLAEEVIVANPNVFALGQNYPNPGNPHTKIDFEMPVEGRAVIKLYDVTGREVMIILDEIKRADYYTVQVNGSELSSGVYFYRITAEGEGKKFTQTNKMILVK